MTYTVEDHLYGSGEKEVEFSEAYSRGPVLTVHPWYREDPEVYVAIRDIDDVMSNIIIPRDEFIEGLLAVFPELKRA